MHTRVDWILVLATVFYLANTPAEFDVPSTLSVDQFGTSYMGESAGAQVGTSIATIRDLNGDAFGDLVIGAPAMPSDTRTGCVYIFFGKSGVSPTSWNRNINLNEADVILSGEKTNDAAGTTVASLGDLNGDGTAELGIAASGNADGGANAGKVYIVLGRKTGWTKNAALGTFADASYIGYTAERTGISLARAGTTGGISDCCEDFLIGVDSHTESGKVGAGRAYLIFGKQSGWAKNVKLTDTSGRTVTDASIASFVGDVADQRVGKTVAGPLDLNRDGYSDLVLGAPGDTASGQNDRGQVAVILGKPSGWSKDQSFAAAAGILIVGEQDGGSFGKSVAAISSVDGDAYRELVVSAPDSDVETSLSDAGKVYLFRGYKGATNWAPGLSLTAANADATWTGEAIFDRAGSSVTELGDFNQDGNGDLLIAADLADYVTGSSDNAGKAYVIYGRSSIAGATSLRDAPLKLLGTALSGRAGQAIAGQLDIDADYYPDLAIGVPFADPTTGVNAGAIYVLRGARFADQDEDGYSPYSGDCDDFDPERSPGQTDVPYDSLDQDCSGEDLIDVDADGYSAVIVGGNDCNDSDATVYPGATEVCNSNKDDDCDGLKDDADPVISGQSTWYQDADEDSYGNAAKSTKQCTQPTGYVANNTDCNDTNPALKPGAQEICDNGVDNDCDTLIDDNDPTIYDGQVSITKLVTYYQDSDNDGYGKDAVTTQKCSQPSGYSGQKGDCDDSNNSVFPGAAEVCNGVDEDCDGTTDENYDDDNDGYLDEALCTGVALPNATDCDDKDPNVYEGATVLCDGKDTDCDGTTTDTGYSSEADSDEDGQRACAGDCDDKDPAIYLDAPELCDVKDNNCNGTVDEVLDDDLDGSTQCDDCDDNDATSNPSATEICDGKDNNCDTVLPPSELDTDEDGFRVCEEDCDDNDEAIFPENPEFCDEKDNDCNGRVDDEASDFETFYQDEDGDGYGAPGATTETCDVPPGYQINSDDCNDSDATVYKDAPAVCDGIDHDCDGQADYLVADFYADNDEFLSAGLCSGLPSDYKLDCDDDEKSINPDAVEVAYDGIDNNCDGVLNEGVLLVDLGPGCACQSRGHTTPPPRFSLGILFLAICALLSMRALGGGRTSPPDDGFIPDGSRYYGCPPSLRHKRPPPFNR